LPHEGGGGMWQTKRPLAASSVPLPHPKCNSNNRRNKK